MKPGRAIGIAAALVVAGLALWALGDLRARPPGPMGVCPDTMRERDFERAALKTHAQELDAVERAAAARRAGREPSDADRDVYCHSEYVADCKATPAADLAERVAAARDRIAADRARLDACTYLR